MQHPSIINYLRLLGLSLGVVMFVVMLILSGQNAQSAAFVQGGTADAHMATPNVASVR